MNLTGTGGFSPGQVNPEEPTQGSYRTLGDYHTQEGCTTQGGNPDQHVFPGSSSPFEYPPPFEQGVLPQVRILIGNGSPSAFLCTEGLDRIKVMTLKNVNRRGNHEM